MYNKKKGKKRRAIGLRRETEAWKVKLQNDFLCFNELCFQKGEKLDSQILFFC